MLSSLLSAKQLAPANEEKREGEKKNALNGSSVELYPEKEKNYICHAQTTSLSPVLKPVHCSTKIKKKKEWKSNSHRNRKKNQKKVKKEEN